MLFETSTQRQENIGESEECALGQGPASWRKQFVGNSPDTQMRDARVTFGIDLVDMLFVVAVP